jgi:hypothetical protein
MKLIHKFYNSIGPGLEFVNFKHKLREYENPKIFDRYYYYQKYSGYVVYFRKLEQE